MAAAARVGRNYLAGFLGFIERVGNALPHPATLFAIFAGVVVLGSALGAYLELEVAHPKDGTAVRAVSLLTVPGLHRMLTEMVRNFTGFAPLGTVLVSMLGIGVAEGSGLMGTALRLLVLWAPRSLLTFALVLAGVLSNMASELGYVLLVPLAAIIFLAVGRHPVAGMAAAFAGVSGGYSANFLIGTVDPLLAGLSQEAAQIIDPAYQVDATANWYFLMASTLFIAFAGTMVTEKIVIPRLGEYRGDEKPGEIHPLSRDEKRGLWMALAAAALFTAALVAGTAPADGFLRHPETGDLLQSPFLKGIVAFIFLGGTLVGVAYGVGARTIRSDSDVIKGMGKAMEMLGIYMVLVFFAAQFVAYFKWTNLGLILAVNGAEMLRASGLGGIPLIVSFVLLSGFINLFMGSASAKWSIMAPVFVPMFMLLGYSPELVQAAYRVGDSTTNIIAPMMSYFAFIIAILQRYDKKAGIGTLVATMLPYTLVFLAVWILLLALWMSMGWSLGPEAGLYLPQPNN